MRTLRFVPIVLASLLAGCELLSPTDPPGPPSSLLADARSRTSVLLTWAAPSEGGEVSSFELDRAAGAGAFETVATPAAGAITLTDEGLVADQSYRYRLRACNDGGCSAYTSEAEARTFGTPTIETTSLPDGAVGQPYTESLDATGAGTEYEWAVISGTLPAGLALAEGTGIISGTPTAEDTATFTVQATSIDGQTAQGTLTVRVGSSLPIVIATIALPPVIVGGQYAVALLADGGGSEQVWTITSGSLPAGLSLDAAGEIRGTPTAEASAAITLQVESFGETDARDFVLDVVPHNEGRYDITPLAVSPAPSDLQPHVDSAIARWERVITGDLQPAYIPPGTFASTSCNGFGGVINGTTLDDVIVLINIAPIDGEGGTLAQAGPCAIRSDGSTHPNTTAAGLLTLDSDDLGPIAGTELVTDIIFHEIGHVLGFGALWDHLELISGSGTSDPRFTGSGAVAEYGDLGGTGDVPLESGGGEATAEGHWRESTFDTEIMTGFAEPVGTAQPLSRVTIASMEDIGYTADRSQADDYTLASALLALGHDDGGGGFDRLLDAPIHVLNPDGTLEPEPVWPR